MSCTFYSFKSGLFGGDYWCDKKDCRVDSDTYYRYCRGYSYSDCPIYKQSNSSGCFITTIVCNILGKSDDDEVLNVLRDFRDNVLQSDSKYSDVLKNYDTIGPVIANSILNDSESEKMASNVYSNMILPIVLLIENKEYDRAVSNYEKMTLSLVDCYGYREYFENLKNNNYGYIDNEFELKMSGHGKRKVLVKRKED